MNCPTNNAGVRIQSRAPECHAELLVPHLFLDATQAIPRDPSDVGEMASLSPSKRGVLGLPLLPAQACASIPLPSPKHRVLLQRGGPAPERSGGGEGEGQHHAVVMMGRHCWHLGVGAGGTENTTLPEKTVQWRKLDRRLQLTLN